MLKQEPSYVRWPKPPTGCALLAYAPARLPRACLLYTSDAADERSSVDLGGRRIIKKKTNNDNNETPHDAE